MKATLLAPDELVLLVVPQADHLRPAARRVDLRRAEDREGRGQRGEVLARGERVEARLPLRSAKVTMVLKPASAGAVASHATSVPETAAELAAAGRAPRPAARPETTMISAKIHPARCPTAVLLLICVPQGWSATDEPRTVNGRSNVGQRSVRIAWEGSLGLTQQDIVHGREGRTASSASFSPRGRRQGS